MKPVRMLTDYEKNYILDNYLTMSYQEIADHIGFKRTWIENYLSKMKRHKIRAAKVLEQEENGFFNVDKRVSWMI